MIRKQNRNFKALYLIVVLLFVLLRANCQTTWYSYQTGAWTNPDVWTTDPGGTTLVNPDNLIPADGDVVFILPSRTVTLSTGNVTTTGLDITIQASGVLDNSLSLFTSTLTALRGKGTLKLKSANFPTVTINTFVQPGGGTVEYYNSNNFSLPAGQTTYNNLTINCSGANALQLNNITINGDLKVLSGTYQINDASAIRRTLIIKGDVTVYSGAAIRVGTGNTTNGTTDPTETGTGGTAPFLDYYVENAHLIEIDGSLINNGTVKFTNQSYPVFNSFPENGIASVFFRGTGDKTITCNGTTDFYNLIIDKGTDQSNVLTVNSAGYDKFRIFGANNASELTGSDANNPDIRKALWIRTGTLKLNGYIFIPSLVEGSASGSGDFYIPGNGALVIDGPDVVVMGTIDDYRVVNLAYNVSVPNNSTAGITTVPSVVPSGFSIYGKVQINDGYLYVGEIGRLIAFGTSAQFIVNGGTVDTKQFQSAGTGKISYWQTGGNLVLRGRFQRSLRYSGTLAEMIATIGNSDYLNTNRSYYGTSTPLGSEPSVGTLSIYQDANIFHMEGGTIKIYDASGATTPSRAIQINSDPSNTSVTGGSVEIYLTAGTGTVTGGVADASYGVATKAPLYNLTITRNSGSQSATLLTIPAASGITAATNPPLVILNDLTLTEPVANAAAVLNASGFDVKVGGDFVINSNAEYTPGTNHTVLNGAEAQTFTNNGVITSGLYRFFVDKNSGTAVLGSNFTVRDSLAIIGGTMDDGGHTLYVKGNIYNAGTHKGTGRIQLNGAGAGYQLLTASITGEPTLGNLEINSTTTNAIAAQLGSDFSVSGLIMTSNKKINVGSYRLTIGGNGITHVPAFSTSCMIQTNGTASDGGLRMSVTAETLTSGNTLVFPTGVNGNYTPSTINGNTAPGTGTGFITIVPVNSIHPAQNSGGQHLNYYWKTKTTGMPTGSNVYFSFYNNISTWGGGAKSAYVLLTGATTWIEGSSGTATKPNINLNTVCSGFISGDVTAGNSGAFNNITAYYSIGSGLWNTYIWSTESHTGSNCNCTPGGNISDIVYIGGVAGRNDSISLPAVTYNLASITIEGSFTNNDSRPTLNLQNNGSRLTVDIIQGAGKLASSSATLYSGSSDLGGLLNNDTALVQYYGNSMTNLPANITNYPTLLITGGNTKILPNVNVVVRRDLRIADATNANNALQLNGSAGNLTVYGDLQFLNGGRLIVPVSATSRNINLYGDINFKYLNTNNVNSIIVNNGAGTVHKFNFYGDTIFSGVSNLTFYQPLANKLDLYIKDPGHTVVTYGTGTFGLNRLFIQKDVLTDTVYFKTNFTLNEANNNTANKSLNLGTGTLILSDAANGVASTINLNLSSGGNDYFDIPSTSALILRNGSKINIKGNSTGSGIRLDGLLKAEGASEINLADGTTDKTGYIEYTGSGSSLINLSGSSVLKANQIRRSASLTTGVLNYTQAGTSTTTIYGQTGFEPTRAKFEVTGTGSAFNMSGTTSLSIINGSGTTYGDLFLRPESSLVTGGDIIFGTGVNSKSFKMDATVPLNNIILNTNGAANTLQLMVNPLVISGNLVLNNANSTFTTNNINVTINGNFTDNGIYNNGSNTTTFSGATQLINGTSLPTFTNLTVSSSVKLTINNDITVNNSLNITSGTFETTTFDVTVKGNVTNNGVYTNSASDDSRLYLNGNSLQQHIAGVGSFGRIELNNSYGARLDNSITLSEDLTLTNGILDINQFLLTLGTNSEILGTAFNDTKMIMSDGVLSNIGIRKDFNGSFNGIFIYPLGTGGKYTPATLTVNATGAGYLRINAINDKHPATLSPYNVLKYYWEAESNITAFSGNLRFEYAPVDVVGSEDLYVAARLIIPPGTGWSKAATGSTTDNVDENTHTVSFDFPAGTSNLGGQYTAGYDSDLPSTIPIYTSNVVSGNWDTPESWSPVAPEGGPNGFAVVINSGNTIYTNGNKRFAYKTTINGTLDVGTSYGHNLGTVNGTGKLTLKQANLPAGSFRSFLSCSGGTLEYGGTSDYTIIADRIDTVRNLLFTGSGTRTLPDKDLVICNQLQINGPTLDNHSNRKLTIGGSFDLTAGKFLSGSGSGATVTFKGSSTQTITGFNTTSPLNNLEIDNSAGLTFNSSIEMNGNLLLTNGIITTTTANKLNMTNQSGTVIPDGGSISSYVNGPMSKYLFGGNYFVFPVGKEIRFGKIKLINVQTGTWETEYYDNAYPDSTVSGTLLQASRTEYWRINSPSDGNTATVQLRWDNLSDITPITTTGGINDIRVTGFNGTDWVEKTSAAPVGDNTYGTVQTSGNIPINSSSDPEYFTLGSISKVKPTITLGASPVVFCGTTIALLPYTATTGYPNQYTIDFDAAGLTDVSTWTKLPASPISIAIPSHTATGTYNATITVSASGSPSNVSIAYPFNLEITPDQTWTGAADNNWNNSGNWSCNFLPNLTTSVLIPNVTNKPVLSTGTTGAARDITINAGSSLTVINNTIQIAGTITSNGTFTATDGTIEMDGTVAQTIGANLFNGNTISNLTINNSNGVSLLGSLNVTGIVKSQNGNLSSDGYLTLVSTATQTALIDGSGSGNVMGNVTIQRYLPVGFGYKYFSSPFQSATVSEFGDDMDLTASFPTFYGYDENRKVSGKDASGWFIYTTTTNILNPLAGYAVNFGTGTAATTVDVTGVVNNAGLSVNLSNHNNTYTQGFNLVGNPYPSPINWNAPSWTKSNIDNALYYFSASVTDQYGGTYSTYINGTSSDGKATAIIPSMQGFFVHVSNGTYPVSGILGIDNSVRINDLTHAFLKSSQVVSTRPLLRLTAGFTGSDTQDPAVIYFDEMASKEFEGKMDALKLMNTDTKVPNFYSLLTDASKLSINALPYPDSNDSLYVIPLGLKTEINGWISLKLKDAEDIFFADNIYLVDAITRTEQNLLLNKEYKVFLNAGEYGGRFYIELIKGEKNIPDNHQDNELFDAYSVNGTLKVNVKFLPGDKGTLTITNIFGQTLFIRNIYEVGYYEYPVKVSSGIYIVTLTSGKVRNSKKVFMYR